MQNMFVTFSESWLATLAWLIQQPETPSRTGFMREAIGISFSVTTNWADEAPGRNLDMVFAKSLAEAIWRGDSNGDNLQNVTDVGRRFLQVPAEFEQSVSAMYGPKLKRQLPWLIKQLQESGGRRAIVYIGEPSDQLVTEREELAHLEYPCTASYQAFIRNDRLLLHVHMRSSSAYRLLPLDFYVARHIQKQLADEVLGSTYAIGNLSFSFGSAHVFCHELPSIANIFANH